MCVVSNVGDMYGRSIPPTYPWVKTVPTTQIVEVAVSRGEFEALKRLVEQIQRDLRAAKAIDVAEGTPDCSHGEKVALIKKLCEAFEVDISDVFA